MNNPKPDCRAGREGRGDPDEEPTIRGTYHFLIHYYILLFSNVELPSPPVSFFPLPPAARAKERSFAVEKSSPDGFPC